MNVPVFWMFDPEADSITSPFVRQPHYNDLENRIRDLETALLGLYSECCHAGHNSDKDYAWPAVMDQAKAALTPQETKDDHG